MVTMMIMVMMFSHYQYIISLKSSPSSQKGARKDHDGRKNRYEVPGTQ